MTTKATMRDNWELTAHKLHYFHVDCENNDNEGVVDGFRKILKDMRKWLKENPCETVELHARWVYDEFDKQYNVVGTIERVKFS